MGAFFSCGASESAKVRNCFVDAIGADIAYVTNKDRSDLANVVLGTRTKNVENLVVVCDHARADKILTESGSSYTATTYSDFSTSVPLKSIISEFDEDIWSVINGIPFVKHAIETIDLHQQIEFVQIAEMIALGGSSIVKVNTRYAGITAENLFGGITLENGVISVPQDAGAGSITINAISYLNGSHVTVEIEIADSRDVTISHERQIVETTASEIDLSFANEYVGENATVSYNGVILGSGAVNNGKLTVDLTKAGATGELMFEVVSKKGGVYYTFGYNVLLATKIIRKAEDLDVLKIKTINASIYGYYVLGADIDVQNAKLSQNLSGQPGYWEGGFGFRGIFDGRNHTISNFTAGANGLFGNIGKGAIIKDVNFINVSCNNDYLSAVLARTIIGAEINNVTIGVIGFAGTTCDNGLLASRYTDGAIMKDVKIDASECTVYSLFGNQVGDKADNTYRGVEIKVKSYTMFANQGKDVNSSDKKIAPAGVNVVVA